MKSFFSRVLRCVFTVLTIWAMAALHVSGQQRATPRFERQYLLSSAREIIEQARYCALITTDAAGRLQARTMDPFLPDDNMVVWLATNPKSRKVAEIRRHPRVALYYFDKENQAYVTIHGIARLVNDPNEKARRWKEEWKDFYPDRQRGYLLIEVRPERLALVSVKKNIVGNPETWSPPTIGFRKQQ